MTPIKILNLTIRPRTGSDGVQFFYANLIFKAYDEFLLEYLKYSQKEYIQRKIFKTYDNIARPFDDSKTPDRFEDVLKYLNDRTCEDIYYKGWDFNESCGWFTYIEKFDCWRFHEFFTDNLVTRSLFNQIQLLGHNCPSTSRSTGGSNLISCFESLKHWWD